MRLPQLPAGHTAGSPLPEAFLRDVRTALIQRRNRPDSAEEEGEDVKAEYTTLFHALLETSTHPGLPTPHLTLATDTLTTWLHRTSHSHALALPLPPGATVWGDLIAHFQRHIDRAPSALSKALKDLLSRTLGAHPPGAARDAWLAGLAANLGAAVRRGAPGKGTWYMLELLLRRGWVRPAAVGDGGVVRDMMAALTQRSAAPAVARAVLALLAARRKDGGWEEEEEEEEVLRVLERPESRGNVVVYLLPPLFKMAPELFSSFTARLGVQGYIAGTLPPRPAVLLCTLQVGKDLGLLHDEDAAVAAPLTAQLLAHAHADVRLAALTLLTASPATTAAVPARVLVALKRALPHFHAECDAEVRNGFFSTMRSFLLRLAAVDDEAVGFRKWYSRFLLSLLRPGASYQRALSALRVLAVLGVRGDEEGVVDAVFNPFDDVRALAAGLVRCDTAPLLARGMAAMQRAGRARDADGLARVMRIRFSQESGAAVVFWALDEVESYLLIAQGDFQRAVRERPVHGLLCGLRMVLERPETWAVAAEWRGVVDRVLRACEAVWSVAGPALCEDSPEGYMPELPAGEAEDDDLNTQTVLSYSWRAVKEAGGLLGGVLCAAPQSVLAAADFSRGGGLLLAQLAALRHRGAFSSVSPPFIAVCARLFAADDAALSSLPPKWLRENLSLITALSHTVTRRSAGLPALITGLLSSCPSAELVTETLSHLLAIAESPPAAARGVDLPQVHALNCIKHLITTPALHSATAPHLSAAFSAAVSCFAAPAWAVRNCGIMLYTALLTRVFGHDGTLDAADFFGRFGAVRGVLMGCLQGHEDEVEVEMVYPALALLVRLRSADPEFRDAVLPWMGCRIWKVREVAARAYSALIPDGGAVAGTVITLLRGAVDGAGQNRIHGSLCAVRILLERVGAEDVPPVWTALETAFPTLLLRSRCAVTKALFLQLLTSHVLPAVRTSTPSDTLPALLSTYIPTAAAVQRELSTSSVVGRSLFKEALVQHLHAVATAHPTPTHLQPLLDLLRSADTDEELALYTCNHLHTHPIPLPSTAHSILWQLTTHPWPLLRTASLLLLLPQYPSPEHPATAEQITSLHALLRHSPHSALRTAVLPLLGALTTQHPAALPLLAPALSTAVGADSEYDTRAAAAECLAVLLPRLGFAPGTAAAWCALYELLMDDDEELRVRAAGVVSAAAAAAKEEAAWGDCCAFEMVPSKAAELLLARMAAAFRRDAWFAGEAARRVMAPGHGYIGGKGADTGTGARLFATEKQNLFIDDVSEVRAWARVLERCAVSEEVVEWVQAGLRALSVHAWGGEQEEGEYVFRVAVEEGVEVVRRWWERGDVEGSVWEGVKRGWEGRRRRGVDG